MKINKKRLWSITPFLLFVLYWTLITPSFKEIIYWVGIGISIIIEIIYLLEEEKGK